MQRSAMVMGIETEYGIVARGEWTDDYPTAVQRASEEVARQLRSSADIMGRQLEITIDGHRVAYQHISNGARFYLDGRHPEMSIAECQTPRDAVIWDAAGERILHMAAQRAGVALGYGVSIYKKNVDGRGHTWGCHENYSINPWLFHRITVEKDRVAEQKTLATWFLVRQLLIGGGKLGFDGKRPSAFQISQRADFIAEFRNDYTMHQRPLIQNRDEALADDEGWKRLHVICGDANLCQWATYFKMGLTGLLLLMWQDLSVKQLPPFPVLDEDFVKVNRFISRDSDLVAQYPVRLVTGRGRLGNRLRLTAAEILSSYVDAMTSYAATRSWSSDAEAAVYREVTAKAQWATGLLRKGNWRSLYGWLDWPTKRVVVEEYLRRNRSTWQQVLEDPELMRRVRTLGDFNYTTLDPSVSVFARLQRAGVIRSAVTGAEVVRAVLKPPKGRAAQRALLAETYVSHVMDGHWDTLTLRQTPYTITVKLSDPAGCDAEQLEFAVGLCPTPLDLMAYTDTHPISGMTMTAERKLVHA